MSNGPAHLAGRFDGTIVPPPACVSLCAYDVPPTATFSYDGPANLRTHGQGRTAAIPPQTWSPNGPETGLDYFGARYFSSAQGRWASPDRPFADQYFHDPQSWNLYAYARNNPLRFVDDNGEGVKELLFGMFNATSTNAVGGIGRARTSDSDVRLGQRVGDAICRTARRTPDGEDRCEIVREGKGYPRELTLPRGCRSVNGSLFGGHDHGARAEIRNDGGRVRRMAIAFNEIEPPGRDFGR